MSILKRYLRAFYDIIYLELAISCGLTPKLHLLTGTGMSSTFDYALKEDNDEKSRASHPARLPSLASPA
jgi:hypothetical protein